LRTVTDFDDFLNNPESQELELPGESATESSSLEEGLAKTDDFSLDDIPDIAEAPSIDDVAELEKELSIPVDHLESGSRERQRFVRNPAQDRRRTFFHQAGTRIPEIADSRDQAESAGAAPKPRPKAARPSLPRQVDFSTRRGRNDSPDGG
jgi:hypothetical protein